MAISDKLTYLNETKNLLKTQINYGLPTEQQITSSTTFRNYVSSIFNAFLEALRTPDTLFTNLPKKSGTGANITLNDTANAPMRIELGASELTQAGTPTPDSPQDIHTISGSNKVVVCGKNLYDVSINLASINASVSGNDITITDSSGWGQSYYFSGSKIYSGQYGIKIFKSSANNIRILVRGYKNNDIYTNAINTTGLLNPVYSSHYKATAYNATNDAIITLDNTCDYYCIGICLVNNGTETINIQITPGNSIPTSYEPYISQEADINLGYENLAKFPENCLLPIPTTWTVIDFGEDKTFDNLTITMFMENALYTNASAYIVNLKTDGGTNNYIMPGNFPGWNANTLLNGKASVIKQNITFRYAYVGTSVNFTQGKMSIQIEEGNVAHNYTPYGKQIEYCKIGNYEDKFIRTSGKNLFDGEWEVGYININTGADIAGQNVRTKNYIRIQPNTQYAISNTTYHDTWAVYYDKNKTFISNQRIKINTGLSGTFTTPNDSNIYYIRWYDAASTGDIPQWQLEKGSTATTYEPYGLNEWYIKKNIGKVVLDGSENWNLGTVFYSDINALLDAGLSGSKIYSNYFTNNLYGASDNYIAIPGEDSSKRIWLKATQFENVNDLTTWLSTHNTDLYYILATPTYTKITGTLAEQLENVYQKLLSYKGVTNISQVNNDLGFVMSATALEDLT